jgi:hypothetical protein
MKTRLSRTLGDEYEIMQRAGLPAEAPIGWVPPQGEPIARAGAG